MYFNVDFHYRFAEQHIYVVLAVLLRNFKLKYPVGESMSQVYHTLLFPDRPVRVIFENRTLWLWWKLYIFFGKWFFLEFTYYELLLITIIIKWFAIFVCKIWIYYIDGTQYSTIFILEGICKIIALKMDMSSLIKKHTYHVHFIISMKLKQGWYCVYGIESIVRMCLLITLNYW